MLSISLIYSFLQNIFFLKKLANSEWKCIKSNVEPLDKKKVENITKNDFEGIDFFVDKECTEYKNNVKGMNYIRQIYV